MFQEAQKVINDTGKQRDELEKQIKKMQEELAEYRRKYVSEVLSVICQFQFIKRNDRLTVAIC